VPTGELRASAPETPFTEPLRDRGMAKCAGHRPTGTAVEARDQVHARDHGAEHGKDW